MMNVFVFDIETIPDVEAGRRIYDLHELSDEDVANVMFNIRRQETGDSEFLRHHLQRIVAISAVLRTGDSFKVWSLGNPESDEAEIIQRFFDGIEKFTPNLVTWNGSGFDLPVIHYRALLHGIQGARYWESGDEDTSFRWNNYLSRYHSRHFDLMDVLSGYQMRATARLDEVAVMLGFPGKMGMSGDKVWESYIDNNISGIRNYCETDVLNTYLIYLKFELIRGKLLSEQYRDEVQRTYNELVAADKAHLADFARELKRHSNHLFD